MVLEDRTHIRILHSLKEKRLNYVSGSFLASEIGITRTAIWKHIHKLQARGYRIESHPKKGYRLLDIPDLLIREEIVPYVGTSWLGRSYHHFDVLPSTNDHAFRLAASGTPNGTVVVAETQTKGRGRLQREWFSTPSRGIYMSVVLTVPLPIRNAPSATQVAALALTKVIRNLYGLNAAIKWPNDILIHNKKIAGILAEMQADQDQVKFLVIGIGINVNQSPSELAGPFRYPATSLAAEIGGFVNRQELLLNFLRQFESEYDLFLSRDFTAVLPELEAASAVIGKTVTIHSERGEFCGKALGFTPEGALRLSTEDKDEIVIWVGDVTRVEGTF
ncbi:MAG: biotin--[acetyl-CoA-carboxylase] ligase [Syntrophobacteraceae bacterium]